MQLKPDETPNLVLGEVRRVEATLSGAVGVNTINSATAVSNTLTAGSTSISGKAVSFLITGNQVGTHHVLLSAVLSSGETVKGYFRVNVTGEPCSSGSDRYDG